MSDRWPGGIVRATPVTPTGPNPTGSAPGIWRLDEVAYWVRQGLWPDANLDPYFNYVSMLLSTTSLGNANNNLFVDSSGAFNPISRNGNTTQGSATPYSANWSNYFDGSGDYLAFPSSTAFSLGTGNFTMEAWVYTADTSFMLFSSDSGGYVGFGYNIDNGSQGLWLGRVGQGPDATSGVQIPYNQWVHIAVTRQSGSVRFFVNGVQSGSTQTVTINYGDFSRGFYVGRDLSTSFDFAGYASNVRMVKGTAVYTANFTVPTAPLTAISGTAFLTCQSNRFRDASANNFTVTPVGETRVTDFAPFSPASPGITYNQSDITNWSGYFDGNGDYFDTQNSSAFNYGTGDFTIECWGYRGSPSNFWCGYSAKDGASFTLFSYAGASSTIQVYSSGFYDSGINPGYNTWFHVAVVRQSGTMKIYINGVLGFSGAYTTNIPSHVVRVGSSTASEWGLGYVSNLRVVKGTAVYTGAFTPPTAPLTAISGTQLLTCQNAAFTDNSSNNFTFTFGGTPTVTGNSPFNTVGYWSNYFDGSGDRLVLPNNAAFQYGAGDFTIEAWIYMTSLSPSSSPVMATSGNTGGSQGTYTGVMSNGNIEFFDYVTTSRIANGGTITTNRWFHIAVTRSGTTLRIFQNGTQVASGTCSSNFTGNAADGGIGSWVVNDTGLFFNGYISNLRVVKGTALYTANFTPPTAPLTAISGTSLLTCQASRLIDSSTNTFTITKNGDVSVQSFDPFYTSTIASNGGSMYFDGSGDFLNTATSFPPIGTGDFTAECWWYPVGTASQEFTYFSVGNVTTTSGFALATDPARGLFLYSGGYVNTSNVAMPVANAWNHIVFTRQSGSLRLYLNGSLRETVSWTNSISAAQVYVGRAANGYFGTPLGYMSDIRYSGTSLYSGSTYTVPTAPLTPSANTGLLLNGMNAGIYDATAINDMETVGNTQLSTAVSKFDGSSVYFDGSSDWLYIPDSPSLRFAGNFTVEFWINFSDVRFNNVMIAGSSGNTQMYILTKSNSTGLRFGLTNGSEFATGSQTWVGGTWYHVALVRNGTDIRFYVNGVNVTDGTPAANSTVFSGAMNIGDNNTLFGVTAFNGYIDDLRITNGVARYTSNFTPPTKAFPTY